MLETVFSTVLRMSAGAAIVILMVALLRLALKGMPKIWSYLLWLLVLVRLLCPVLPETVFSPAMEVDASLNRVETYTRNIELFTGEEVTPAESMHVDPEKMVEARPSEPYESGEKSLSLGDLLALLWLMGAAAVLLWGGVSMGKLRRKLAAAVPIEKGVYLADHIDTPFVTGLVRPKVYLPSDLTEEWMGSILLHERYHIRRLDPVVKFLYFVALAVHWFDPMVWLAYRLMTRDMEMSCDEAVMKQLDGDARREYAQSLLCLATGRRSFPAPLAFGEGDTEQRIKNVLAYKKPALWISALGVALCLAAGLFILAEPAGYTSSKLEYPGLSWGDSPEEVMSALKDMGSSRMILEESRWEADETRSYGGYAVQIGDVEMFGQSVTSAVFRFAEYSWNPGQLMLEEIILYYPDGHDGEAADLDALEAEVTDMFGAPAEEVLRRTWYAGYAEIREERSPVNPSFTLWESEDTVLDALSEEEIRAIYGHMVGTYAESDIWLPSLEEFKTTLELPAARIILQESYFSLLGVDRELSQEARDRGTTDYVLTLSGQAYLSYLDAAQTAKEP